MQRARRFMAVAIAVAVLPVTVSLTATPAGAAAKAQYDVGVSSAAPLPKSMTAAQAARRGSVVSPMTATPSGFTLVGTKRSPYIYDSSTVYQGSYHCATSCTLVGEVATQLHEVAIGGSSHTWELTMNMKEYQNAGGLSWTYSATYWCGVNIKNATDTLCTNGAAPSNASMSTNDLVNKPWGATNGITVFPMVQASTIFSNGVMDTTKFRGYDTLSYSSTTRLADRSDTGN